LTVYHSFVCSNL